MHKDLQNPDYVRWRNFLKGAENWDLGQIRDFEISELRRITALAFEKTSGYRDLFKNAGVDPADLDSFESFQKFPFTEKEIFRDRLEEFSIETPGRIYVTTGGSSGIPLGMYRDKVSFARELASKAHQYERVGWREGDRQMVFRGLPIKTTDHTEFIQDLNELRCSTYQFIPENLRRYREKAFEYQPDWIRCYPSAGFLLATFLEENRLDFPKIEGILCASEMLFDFQKEKMERVFRTRVFSHYGHYELAALAGFCEYTDFYHVLPHYGFVELIDENGQTVREPGQTGEIVATSFLMNTTPFIRYRTGDLAVFRGLGCPECGRPYQIWEKVVGRRQELIVAENGRLISMTMLNMHDDIYDNLRQYQFFQDRPGRVVLRFVPKETYTQNVGEMIRERLRIKLGEDIILDLEEVPEIELTKRGKHKTLVQKLKLEDKILTPE